MDVTGLAGLELFDGLSDEELALVAAEAVEVEAPAGKDLVRDGALAWDFFVIRQGTADVEQGHARMTSLGPGDYFGEVGVFASDRRRTASVVSTSPVRAIRLTAHQLRTLCDRVPLLSERLHATAAERDR
jgi:CRP-like cAMP-binding protein